MEFLKQLIFIDQKTKTLSHSKALSVLAGLVMNASFIYLIVTGKSANVELWLVFGGLFLSNHAANKIINLRYGRSIDRESK